MKNQEEPSKWKQMLNKVPEVTFYFWIIKVLCTTIGETAADYLNTTLNLGLNGTSLVMGILLVIVLVFQFSAKKYIPTIYWLAVVLISVVGTLITDNLTDNFGISLVTTTVVFSICLAFTFIIWYMQEKTLSIKSITTMKREVFYWITILFTFALGTATGDLIAEQFNLGYLLTLLLFIALIAVVYILNRFFKLNSVITFWIAYIFTRPLGASIGDYLSQANTDGGLGLGTTVTSLIFLGAIFVLVLYLTITKKDQIKSDINSDTHALT